ncbi:MAG: hypothetical protein JWR52_1103 [Marmoricola sp.]|nr:hypothetical protein [Marmoricola sp.]
MGRGRVLARRLHGWSGCCGPEPRIQGHRSQNCVIARCITHARAGDSALSTFGATETIAGHRYPRTPDPSCDRGGLDRVVTLSCPRSPLLLVRTIPHADAESCRLSITSADRLIRARFRRGGFDRRHPQTTPTLSPTIGQIKIEPTGREAPLQTVEWCRPRQSSTWSTKITAVAVCRPTAPAQPIKARKRVTDLRTPDSRLSSRQTP